MAKKTDIVEDSHNTTEIKTTKGSSSRIIVGVIIAAVLVVGVFSINTLLKKQQDIRERAQTAPSVNRIYFGGQNWYVHGVNVPWYNWACDFGCNSTNGKSGGVSTNMSTLQSGFSKVQGAGMHVVRWWVFPGDPWQITRNSSGVPTGIDPAVYKDFDAAITLANQYDVYYDFVLFSGPTAIPTTWETDTTQRAALVSALGTLFAHYASNPRILSWEIYNEPEFDIWNGKIAQSPVVDTGTAIAASVHSNSPGTLVTVGNAYADGMPMWANSNLDYYSPHWYDYMSSGNYCIICHNYAYYQSLYGIKIPMVIGEFYTGDSTTSPTSTQRFSYWYNNGYAGAWGWSLFPDRTNDKLAVDFTAATNFASGKTDLGPISSLITTPAITATIAPTSTTAPTPSNIPTATPTLSPTPTPTNTDTQAPSVSVTNPVNGAAVAVRSTITITATASDNVGVARVDFLVNGTLTCSDTSSPYTCAWKVPGSKRRTYTITAKAYDFAGNTSSSSVSVTSK